MADILWLRPSDSPGRSGIAPVPPGFLRKYGDFTIWVGSDTRGYLDYSGFDPDRRGIDWAEDETDHTWLAVTRYGDDVFLHWRMARQSSRTSDSRRGW